MWIFTSKSFLSVVVDRNHPSRLLVRARMEGDIEVMFPNAKAFIDEMADYKYRAFVTKNEFNSALEDYTVNLNYDKFKPSIPSHQALRQQAYLDVWAVMEAYQD